MISPSSHAHNNRLSFSAHRVPCPLCKARRGFAPLSNHTDGGKCFACGAFLPPSDSGTRNRGPTGIFRNPVPRGGRPARVLIDAIPSRLWSRVPITSTYDYHDESGRVLFHVDRKEREALYSYADGTELWEHEKTFQQRPHGVERGYTGCMDGVRRVLYNLPSVLQAIRHGWPVIVVEGEKDADTYNDLFREELGYDARATCCPGGAGRWLAYGSGYTDSLRGADVILDGDMDAAGLRHIRMVAEALHGIAKRVRVVPDLFTATREETR